MPKKTPFHTVGLEHGAKMIELFDYYLPWEYAPGHAAEHLGTRERASLCDLHYMGVFSVEGPDAVSLMQKVGVNDFAKLSIGGVRYTAMCDEDGNMIDDGTVWRMSPDRFIVITGAEADHEWIAKHAEGLQVTTSNITESHTTLALQGPQSTAILSRITEIDLDSIRYYRFTSGKVAGVESLVARMGYTGEFGYEVHCDASNARKVWTAVMEAGAREKIVPCGQAALESLRQEAGYILVGNEHDRNTNPFEARIGWTVKFGKSDFIGKKALQRVVHEGLKRRLVWFKLPGGEVAKTGDAVLSGGTEIGKVTSGSYSPTFKAGTALGYVAPPFAIPGATFDIQTAGQSCHARLSVMPLYDPGNRLTLARS